ncbi:MAG: hypothetical protein ACI9CD_000761 [Candidatus Deianiraeaceae bacterium]|jgi:hypothetical protein
MSDDKSNKTKIVQNIQKGAIIPSHWLPKTPQKPTPTKSTNTGENKKK